MAKRIIQQPHVRGNIPQTDIQDAVKTVVSNRKKIMNTYDKKYLDLCNTILDEGVLKENRTGVNTIATTGLSIRHNMAEGFPLLTTKKMAFKSIRVELEGFLNGITSKSWYKERGCNIWNEWCNPQEVPYGKDAATKAAMAEEDDLGRIYGAQWRDWRYNKSDVDLYKDYLAANLEKYRNDDGSQYTLHEFKDKLEIDETFFSVFGIQEHSIDQLQGILNTLIADPNDRRMICSAWAPHDLDKMALPPCHFAWQTIVVGDRLDLVWNQRSCDVFLGLGFNVASYALLLHLLAKHANLKEGILTGHFGDIHIYENHIDQIRNQSEREPFNLPTIETDYPGFLHWTHKDTKLIGYKCHDKIYGEVAV